VFWDLHVWNPRDKQRPQAILLPKFNQYPGRQLWRRDCSMADSHNFLPEGSFSLRRMYWRTVTQTEGREETIDWLVGLFVRIMQSVPMIYNKMNAVSRWLKFTYLRPSVWHDNFIRCHGDLYCRPKVTILSILCLQSDGIGLFLNQMRDFHTKGRHYLLWSLSYSTFYSNYKLWNLG